MSTEISGSTGTSQPAVPQPRVAADGYPTSSSAGPSPTPPPVPGADYRKTPFWRVYDTIAQLIDLRRGWDKLPVPAGLAVLIGVRNILRQQNLHDPSTVVPIVNAAPVPERTPGHLVSRSVDGTYNDLDHPDMGRAGARFGRNIPLDKVLPVTQEQLMEPSPREVSRRLLTRTTFLPATSINTMAASWLQFMIHDWFTHGEGDTSRLVDIPLKPGDPWYENPMRIPRIKNDPTRPADTTGPIITVNDVTHWWDGSSIYGSSADEQQRVRSGEGGKLRLTADGQLPFPDDPALDPTMKPGWWTGLGMLMTLFAREHNAVCDALAAEYPHWDDEELFQRARLVVAALLAKIHTVEWTPAVISHPTTVFALRANWFGVAGERIARAFGRISSSEVISGIPGAATEHYGVPFSLTEEFTSVYRMHPLLPDDFDLRTAAADRSLAQLGFRAFSGPHSKEIAAKYALGDLFYSFGTTHPGAIVLRNYPKFLQEYERPDGKKIDLASTDLVRVRELGVPRYCEFRRLLHLQAPATFAELTDDAGLAADMADLYGDVEKVDLMVGLFAEKRPAGFAFSDTAFRIFILMASRRLNSDRFFTRDFRPEVYSPTGLTWVRDNDMRTVLLRHFPELRPALRHSDNAFAPWARVTD
ncbi:MAG: peroxidase family protein [Blastococcus sp.]